MLREAASRCPARSSPRGSAPQGGSYRTRPVPTEGFRAPLRSEIKPSDPGARRTGARRRAIHACVRSRSPTHPARADPARHRGIVLAVATGVVLVASRAARRAQPAQYTRRTPEVTPLYAVVRDELETYLARAHERERIVPRFVERELRAYLECGLLCHGFVRARCADCGLDRLVAFSCKGRGFCPACVGRRMADTAAHLVDRVLPQAPVRQWVLALPRAAQLADRPVRGTPRTPANRAAPTRSSPRLTHPHPRRRAHAGSLGPRSCSASS